MADTQRNPWQSIGSTLGHDHPLLSHIRPTDARFSKPAVGAASLARQSSVSASAIRRSRSVKKAPAAKMNKFMHRLSWNQRAEDYLFSKAQLQRQPSFVITPDISSYSYKFKTRDLARRKPRARFSRTSQPVAVWKNSRPMDVLMNSGQVDTLPFLSLTGSNKNGKHSQKTSNGTISSALSVTPLVPSTETNAPVGVDANSEDLIDLGHSYTETDHNRDTNNTSSSNDRSKELKKIQLPVKAHHQSSSSTDANRHSDPLSESTHHSRGSWLDTIPQTPISESQRRRSAPVPGDLSHHSVLSNQLAASQNPRSSVLDATLNEALGSENADISLDQQAPPIPPQSASRVMARTTNASPPHSPTSARSSYRPESWRRSAVIARGGLDSIIAEAAVDDSESERVNLAVAWNQYLRRAVAQRAIESIDRKSWELKNELRWSRNLGWESEVELESSDGQSSSGDHKTDESDSYSVSTSEGGSTRADRHSPDLSFGSTPRSQSPSLSFTSSREHVATRTPKSRQQPYSGANSPRAVTDYGSSQGALQATPMMGASPGKASTSKLAPLHSPRQLASSSVEALASMERLSFGDVLNRAPEKYTTLFRDSDVAWQPENSSSLGETDSTSSSSSSHLNEDDSIFPSQPDRMVALQTDHIHRSENLPVEVRNGEVLKMNEHYGYSSPHLHSQATLRSPAQTAKSREAEFDFSDQSSSRKRSLPLSPVASPPLSPNTENAASLQSFQTSHSSEKKLPTVLDVSDLSKPSHSGGLVTPLLRSQALGSAISVGSTPENTEAASQIVRSQSQWKKKNPEVKRMRKSHSQEHLVHTRQKTMESMWGGEEEDSDGGQPN